MKNPTADGLKALIRSPKPAFAAAGETRGGHSDGTFRVIYDGQGGWWIERPWGIEFRSGGRTILERADALDVIDLPTVSNNDVKAPWSAASPTWSRRFSNPVAP